MCQKNYKGRIWSGPSLVKSQHLVEINANSLLKNVKKTWIIG